MVSPWLRSFHETGLWLVATGIAGIVIWSITFSGRRLRTVCWSTGFVIAIVLVSGCIQCLRYPIPDLHHEWMQLPPREAFLELEVTTLEYSPTADKEGRARFRARILSSRYPTIPLEEIEEIECLLWKPLDMAAPIEGSHLTARGVLYNELLTPIPHLQYRHGTILEILSLEKARNGTLRDRLLLQITDTLQLGAPEGSNLPNYIQSIVTGDKRYLDRFDIEQFKAAGVMHFLAISGFHLGVIALMVHTVLQIMRVPNRWIGLITVVLCSVYVWITGSPVSAQRALLMLAIFFAARLVQRKPDLLSATAASAWIILLISPEQLLNAGYQLSFLIVAGLIIHAAPLQKLLAGRIGADPFLPRDFQSLLHRWVEPCRYYLVASFSVSWTAFWIGLPVVCRYFGNVPFPAIVLNTVLAPLFALVLVAGVLSVISGFLHLFVFAEFINHAVWVLLSMIVKLINVSSWFPWLSLEKEGNAVVALCTIGILLFLMLGFNPSRKRNRWIFGAVPLLSFTSVFVQDWVSHLLR